MKDNDRMTAFEVYNAMKPDKVASHHPKVIISGTAVKVGLDVYGLPSIEVSESANVKGRVLYVLPFLDYLKLRHVSKGDKVEIQGEVRGFAPQYDIVVVKESKILKVNDKENENNRS